MNLSYLAVPMIHLVAVEGLDHARNLLWHTHNHLCWVPALPTSPRNLVRTDLWECRLLGRPSNQSTETSSSLVGPMEPSKSVAARPGSAARRRNKSESHSQTAWPAPSSPFTADLSGSHKLLKPNQIPPRLCISALSSRCLERPSAAAEIPMLG